MNIYDMAQDDAEQKPRSQTRRRLVTPSHKNQSLAASVMASSWQTAPYYPMSRYAVTGNVARWCCATVPCQATPRHMKSREANQGQVEPIHATLRSTKASQDYVMELKPSYARKNDAQPTCARLMSCYSFHATPVS